MDPENKTSETTRRILAYAVMSLLSFVVVVMGGIGAILTVSCWQGSGTCQVETEALDVLNRSFSPLFTALIGLVGSITGFYFGARQSETDEKNKKSS